MFQAFAGLSCGGIHQTTVETHAHSAAKRLGDRHSVYL